MHFLLPYARIELLIPTILTRQQDPEHRPILKGGQTAVKLRSHVARAEWLD